MERHETVVVGAGPAGLAVAAALGRAGVETVVLEAADAVAARWRTRYDNLRLNTVRWTSRLPGLRWERRYGLYPSRDELVRYLERYAARHRLAVRFGTRVERLDPDGEGDWRVTTATGDALVARYVVVATGPDAEPFTPDWPGRGRFTGDFLHACEYRSPEPYRGREVLIVGAGNSGVDIAGDLLRHEARVVVSMRTPPSIVPRRYLGVPLNVSAIALERLPVRLADEVGALAQRLAFGDLAPYGLPRAPVGMFTRARVEAVAPAVDDGFVAALKAGRIEIVPPVDRLEEAEVVLGDGRRRRPAAVICATGYRPGLAPLVGRLGVLDAAGRPLFHAAPEHPAAPRLYVAGMQPALSGQLRVASVHARRIARAVARHRRRTGVVGGRRRAGGVARRAREPMGGAGFEPA